MERRLDSMSREPCINTPKSTPGRGCGNQLALVADSGKR